MSKTVPKPCLFGEIMVSHAESAFPQGLFICQKHAPGFLDMPLFPMGGEGGYEVLSRHWEKTHGLTSRVSQISQ